MMLKQWRLERDLTLSEMAVRLGIENARTYQRYEDGENRPDAPIVARILSVTDSAVTLRDMHELRLQWLQQNKPPAMQVRIDVAEIVE